MNLSRLFRGLTFAALVAASSLSGGYYWRGLQDRAASSLGLSDVPAFEAFYESESFSEIENTRSLLRAVANRTLTEARIHRDLIKPPTTAKPYAGPTYTAQDVITELDRAVEELAGTEEALQLTQELLDLFRHQKLYGRWVERYLQALYRSPMHPMVGRLAGEAITFGRAAGREGEVVSALNHVAEIPLDFGGKHEVELALASRGGGVEFAGMRRPGGP